MTTLEILKAAREKIADEKNWMQREFAQDGNARGIEPTSPEACKWCALGAIRAICETQSIWDAMDALRKGFPGGYRDYSIAMFNDSHTHPEVLAVFDRAIAKLEAL